jgi:hypothetical protein
LLRDGDASVRRFGVRVLFFLASSLRLRLLSSPNDRSSLPDSDEPFLGVDSNCFILVEELLTKFCLRGLLNSFFFLARSRTFFMIALSCPAEELLLVDGEEENMVDFRLDQDSRFDLTPLELVSLPESLGCARPEFLLLDGYDCIIFRKNALCWSSDCNAEVFDRLSPNIPEDLFFDGVFSWRGGVGCDADDFSGVFVFPSSMEVRRRLLTDRFSS